MKSNLKDFNDYQRLKCIFFFYQVNNSNCQDTSTIVKALSEAARVTNNYLDGEEAVEAVKELGSKCFFCMIIKVRCN